MCFHLIVNIKQVSGAHLLKNGIGDATAAHLSQTLPVGSLHPCDVLMSTALTTDNVIELRYIQYIQSLKTWK